MRKIRTRLLTADRWNRRCSNDEEFSQLIFRTPFSETALARRAEREATDARLQVTAPHEWLLVSGLGLALAALLVYGLLGRVESSISFDTVLVQPGERVDVVVGVSGVVVEMLSQVGETVEQDQPIALIRVPEPERRGLDAARLGGTAEDSDHSQSGEGGFVSRSILAPQGGEIAMLALVAGQRVEANELAARIRVQSSGPQEALAFVTSEQAARLAPGLSAQVSLDIPISGATQMLPARIVSVSPRAAPLPRWTLELGIDPPPRAHLVRAALMESERITLGDGIGGTLRIALGDRPLISLLFSNVGN